MCLRLPARAAFARLLGLGLELGDRSPVQRLVLGARAAHRGLNPGAGERSRVITRSHHRVRRVRSSRSHPEPRTPERRRNLGTLPARRADGRAGGDLRQGERKQAQAGHAVVPGAVQLVVHRTPHPPAVANEPLGSGAADDVSLGPMHIGGVFDQIAPGLDGFAVQPERAGTLGIESQVGHPARGGSRRSRAFPGKSSPRSCRPRARSSAPPAESSRASQAW